MVKQAAFAAERAANAAQPAVFAPPVATFNNRDRARTIDVANGVALSVESTQGIPPQRSAALKASSVPSPCYAIG